MVKGVYDNIYRLDEETSSGPIQGHTDVQKSKLKTDGIFELFGNKKTDLIMERVSTNLNHFLVSVGS